MKSVISHYGWIIVTIIIITILILLSDNYAMYMHKTNEVMAEGMGTTANQYIGEAFNAFKDKYSVVAGESSYGEIKVEKNTFVEGESVKFTVITCDEGYALKKVIVKRSDEATTEIIGLSLAAGQSSSFACPNCNAEIIAIFEPV